MRSQEEIEEFVNVGLRQLDVIVSLVQLERDPKISFAQLDSFCREHDEDILDGLASVHLFNKDKQQKEILEKEFGEILDLLKKGQTEEYNEDVQPSFYFTQNGYNEPPLLNRVEKNNDTENLFIKIDKGIFDEQKNNTDKQG